jgi:ATP/maltotriose-dependent transcriptional regulator MalT
VQEGDLAGARRKYEEALALRNALGEKGGAAESSLAIAAVSLEEGKLGEAESSARKAAEEFHQEKQVADEASAQIVLARVLLAHGDPMAAKEAIDRALQLARASQNRGIQLLTKITVARITVALGKPADAARSLQDTQGEAAKFGFGRYELESRLELGEIEMKSGMVVAGRTHLRALEKNARAKSFLLIARKAAVAAKGTARANPQAD